MASTKQTTSEGSKSEDIQLVVNDFSIVEGSQPTSQEYLWNQLANAVTFASKQDQVVWSIFGVFWAANAVLLVALFTTGDFPKKSVGIIVSLVGLALSVVWLLIEQRAIGWLKFYEAIIKELEKTHLFVPPLVTFMNNPAKIEGKSTRLVVLAFPVVSALLWAIAAWWFLFVAGN